jgi:hypothetical protein
MEWILATELGPAEDKMAEYRRRLADARQRLMGNEAAAATADFGVGKMAANIVHIE